MSLRKLTRAVFKASIKDGKLVFNNEAYFRTLMGHYEDTDKVRVIIEKERGTRSTRANNYLWGVVYQLISEHTGYTPEEIHEVMRSKYLRSKRLWRGGDITTLKSTTELNSLEFGEYVASVIQEGAELGVVIPFADKDWQVKEEFNL